MWLVSCLHFPICHLHFFGLFIPFSGCNTRVLQDTEEYLDFVKRQISISLNNTAWEAVS